MSIEETKNLDKSFNLNDENFNLSGEGEKIFFEDGQENNQAFSEQNEEISEEMILEEKRREFAKLDLEASEWLKKKKRLNFWDKKSKESSLTKDSYGENENNEYFERKKEYIEALIAFRESRLKELDSGDFSEEEKNQRRQEIIKETVHQEANRLYDTKTALVFESKDNSLKEKTKEVTGKAIEWYRGLSFKKKMAISASLLGVGAGAGMVGGATGVVLATGAFAGIKAQRILSGAAVTVGLEGWLHKRQEKKAEKEAVELFADRLKSRLKDLNEEMDEKIFELEGRKSSELYKRYILSGTAGVLVGSGAVGKAIFGTADFFGLTGDRVGELLDKVSEKVGGFFSSNEAYAGEGVTQTAEGIADGQTNIIEETEALGTYSSYEFTRLDFVKDDQGNILGIDYAGNFLNFNPTSFIETSLAEADSGFGLDDKIKMEDSLKELKIYQQIIEKIEDQAEINKAEYEWTKDTFNEKLEDLKDKYGAFIKEDEMEKAFAVKDLFETDTESFEDTSDTEQVSEEEIKDSEPETHESTIVETEKEPEAVETETPEEVTKEPEKETEVIETKTPEEAVVQTEEEINEVKSETPEESTAQLEEEFTVLSDELEKKTSEKVVVADFEEDTVETDSSKISESPEPAPSEPTVSSPDTSGEVEFESSKFSTNIEQGSSVWKTTEGLLKENFTDQFESLNDAQRTHLVNQIVNRVAENPAEFGLVGVEDIDKVPAGQFFDISPLTDGEQIEKMFDLTKDNTDVGVAVEEVSKTEEVEKVKVDSTETTVSEPEPATPESSVSSSDTSGVEFESSKFSTNIEQGSSVWKTTEGLLKENFTDQFESLNDAQRTHLVNQIVNRVAENPAEFGLVGVEDIDKVPAGQFFDISPLTDGEVMEKILESAKNLSDEDISNIVSNNEKIEDWIKENPNKALTSERVQEIINITGEKVNEAHPLMVSNLMEEYRIENTPKNVEAIKSIIQTVESTDIATHSKEALKVLYFENWNADNVPSEKVKQTLSGFLGKSYDDNRYFFAGGGDISKEINGDVKILLKEIGLSEERKSELLITLSLDGNVTMEGPSEEWAVDKKDLNSRSLGELKNKISNFIKK